MTEPDDLLPRALARLPLTYDECRARFRRAAREAGIEVESWPIDALGPDGQELTVDRATIGHRAAPTVLLVLSGVHGVEGFIGSALQADLLGRVRADDLPDGVAVELVHAVNPWGMAWSRRQNESNVDLNRNWRRDLDEPTHNDAYDELHPIACPDAPELPDPAEVLAAANDLVARRGLAWVRDAITVGQYRHRDGLHYGGDRTEQSNQILESFAARLVDRSRLLILDLHTGHGPRGEITLLSDAPPDSDQDRLLRSWFGSAAVEATEDNPEATTGTKNGQIANGIRDLLPPGRAVSTSVEFGTASDLEQLAATYQAQWVHRRGDPSVPAHAAAVWRYRCCFTPDDPAWERTALERGRAVLDRGLAAASTWDRGA